MDFVHKKEYKLNMKKKLIHQFETCINYSTYIKISLYKMFSSNL